MFLNVFIPGAFAIPSGRLFQAVTILILNAFCLIGFDDLCKYTLRECSLPAHLSATSVHNLINEAVSLS